MYFYVKARCEASMKKELRNVRIQLCKRTGEVYKATCSCPAGKSGYCNHLMALLYEIAEYSLNQLTEVPREKACTSVLRKWGVPGNKEVVKETVMRTALTSSDQKKGIPPTLYDARLNFNQIKNVPYMLDWDCNICEHCSVSKHEFFQKLKVTHIESQSIDKRTRKQRESKEWKEYRKTG